MLRLEKYGRIGFSLGRWTPMDPNAPKSMRAHARESFELVTTFFRSLTWWQESLFWRSSCDLCKTTEFGNFRFLSKPFHISQHQYFTYSSPPTVAVQHIGSQCVEVQRCRKTWFWPKLGQQCCIKEWVHSWGFSLNNKTIKLHFCINYETFTLQHKLIVDCTTWLNSTLTSKQ